MCRKLDARAEPTYFLHDNKKCVEKMLKQIPVPVQTAYLELVRRHDNRPSPSYLGAVMKASRGGADCWVVRRRAGDKVVETYLGLDTPEIRESVERLKRDLASLKDWRKTTSSIVSMLRSAGCLAPDLTAGRVFAALAEAGFFRRGGLLGGTHAFRLYPLMLGYEAPLDEAYTDDVDLLAPRGLTLLAPEEKSVISALEGRGLRVDARFGGFEDEVHRWIVEGSTEIEVLTTTGSDRKPVSKLKGVGVPAQALRYLEFGLVEPVTAVALHREGVELRIPAPERFGLHKLIVSQLREGKYREKRRKDLRQAEWLLKALLETRPYDLLRAWEDLLGRGPKWRKLAEKGLRELPDRGQPIVDALEDLG